MHRYVSVCIPVYGAEKYIERCARSLFEQTLDSLEYIFVDDCSPDNSIAVMQKVLEEYPQRKDQVKVIRHEVNQGVGAARNHGVAACTGDYIIHCDPDDWVDLDIYETMYNKAIETNADIVCCPFIEEYSNRKKRIDIITASTVAEFAQKNMGGVLNSLSNKLCKKHLAKGEYICCPEHICMGEDLLRTVQMFGRCEKIAFCNDTYYHYWRDDTSASTRTLERKYLNQLCELVEIIENLSVNVFPGFIATLKSQVLFSALKTRNVSSKEFKGIYHAFGCINVSKVKCFPAWKKILLLIALISYPLAKFICNILLKIKFK